MNLILFYMNGYHESKLKEITHVYCNMSIPKYLNTTPCQFPISKTRRSINYIKSLIQSDISSASRNEKIHHITTILTNNNLAETTQWRLRTKNSMNDKKIHIMSSAKNSNFRNSLEFINQFTKCQDINDLTDVLIICTNKVRCESVIEIVDAIENTVFKRMINLGVETIKLTVMFDEADESNNITLSCKLIKRIKNENVISSFHFVTATPVENFWKKLRKECNIDKLVNLSATLSEEDLEEMFDHYRKLEDHNIIYIPPNMDAFDNATYINEIYLKPNNNTKIRLYAPSEMYIESHNNMKDYLLSLGYIVVIINGKEKMIYYDYDKKISMKDFVSEYITFGKKSDVEMYEVLSKLDEMYQTRNIAITGYKCIIRGITFQSTGFKFTDFMVNDINDLASAVQMIGRNNGGCQFVSKNNVYISKQQYDSALNFNKYQFEIMKFNPVMLTETDYRELTSKEKDMDYWTIPFTFKLNADDYTILSRKNGINFNREFIKKFMLQKFNVKIDKIDQILHPIPEDGYKKNIMPLLNATNECKKCSLHRSKAKEKNIEVDNIYFDHKNKTIIISKYRGDLKIQGAM